MSPSVRAEVEIPKIKCKAKAQANAKAVDAQPDGGDRRAPMFKYNPTALSGNTHRGPHTPAASPPLFSI